MGFFNLLSCELIGLYSASITGRECQLGEVWGLSSLNSKRFFENKSNAISLDLHLHLYLSQQVSESY